MGMPPVLTMNPAHRKSPTANVKAARMGEIPLASAGVPKRFCTPTKVQNGAEAANDMAFDYFYGQQAEQFAFYRIPKPLFSDKRFRGISTASSDHPVVGRFLYIYPNGRERRNNLHEKTESRSATE